MNGAKGLNHSEDSYVVGMHLKYPGLRPVSLVLAMTWMGQISPRNAGSKVARLATRRAVTLGKRCLIEFIPWVTSTERFRDYGWRTTWKLCLRKGTSFSMTEKRLDMLPVQLARQSRIRNWHWAMFGEKLARPGRNCGVRLERTKSRRTSWNCLSSEQL